MIAISSPSMIMDAASITSVTADEAYSLLQTSLARFLALVETLDSSDFNYLYTIPHRFRILKINLYLIGITVHGKFRD